jgi:outer membrane protein assembly factor BamB
LTQRGEFRDAASRLIKIVMKYPAGHLAMTPPASQPDSKTPPPQSQPVQGRIILGSGARARDLLIRLASEHPKEAAEAAEIECPGLFRRNEPARQTGTGTAENGTGSASSMEQLALVFGFTPAGWAAMVRLGEEDLDAGRWGLAELRFQTALRNAADPASRGNCLWRIAEAQVRASRLDDAAASLDELTRTVKGQDVSLALGNQSIKPADATDLVRREIIEGRTAGKNGVPASQPGQPVQAGLGAETSPTTQPAGVLSARMVFSYHPTVFDMGVRRSYWPTFWGRPEPMAAVEGSTAWFHDSANLWAVDWQNGKLLWHYRSPGQLYEVQHGNRGFANHVDEASQSSRCYTLAACPTRAGTVLCGRFRRASSEDPETTRGALWYDLRCLRASDGRLLWTTHSMTELAELSFGCDPVAAYDRLYVVAFEPQQISTAYLVCLDPATGRVLFKSQIASDTDSFSGSSGDFFSAAGGIVAADGRIYLSSDRGSFVSMDALDGSLQWVSPLDRTVGKDAFYYGVSFQKMHFHSHGPPWGGGLERLHCPPAVGTSTLYGLTRDSYALFAMDRATGGKVFVHPVRNAVELLGETGGLIVAASRAGLYALHADTGRIAWETPVPMVPRSPWRSGFLNLRDGLIYWPCLDQLLVVSARDGQIVRRWTIDSPEPLTTIRPLPSGELAGFCSDGAIDRFVVLSAGKQNTLRLAEEPAAGTIDPMSLSVLAAPDDPPPAALNPPPANRPLPLPPLQLLWRARFSIGDLFNGSYLAQIVDDAKGQPRLLVAAGDKLQCYQFDTIGALLWSAPTPPGPAAIKMFRDGRICLRWTHGFIVYELATGKRVVNWASAPIHPAKPEGGVYGDITDVCEGKDIIAVCAANAAAGVRPSDGQTLWDRGVNCYPNWGNQVGAMAGGIVFHVHQGSNMGGGSFLQLLDEQTGKPAWRYDFPANTATVFGDGVVWGRADDNHRLSMVTISPAGAKEAWARELGPTADIRFQGDRIFVLRSNQILVLDRATGRDVGSGPVSGINAYFSPGASTMAYQSQTGTYTPREVFAVNLANGANLWKIIGLDGGPAIETLPNQIFLPTATEYGGWYYCCIDNVWWPLGTLTSIDPQTGRMLARFPLPGRVIWDSHSIQQRDNLLLVRTHMGPVVLGAASLRPPVAVREAVTSLASHRTPANERQFETFREDLMRHQPAAVGCEKIDQPIALDGEFDDWAGAKWTTVADATAWSPADGGAMPDSAKKWSGPDDCSFRFAVRHDDKTLYLAVEVHDSDFSPPAAEGIFTPGDSVEVGISRMDRGWDGLAVDYHGVHPDIKVVLALLNNRPAVTCLWNGQGTELAASVRPGVVRYEAAIPLRNGYRGPLDPAQIGLAIQVNDCDGGRPKGAMRWAGGLGSTNANAQFGRVCIAPLSDGEIAQRRPVIDLLADSNLAWNLTRPILDAELALTGPAAVADEARGFLQRHPTSYNSAKALAWYQAALQLAGDKDALAKTADLANQAKVPASQSDRARTRIFAQLKLTPGHHPRAVGLRFKMAGGNWERHSDDGVYWGENMGPLVGGMLYLGPLPEGDNIELSFPAGLLRLIDEPVANVMFLHQGCQTWWGDLGVIDSAGKRSVWVAGAGKPDVASRENHNWVNEPAPDGSPAHRCRSFNTFWTEHWLGAPRVIIPVVAGAAAGNGHLATDKCLQAAWLIPDSRLAYELLTATNDDQAAARFVREFPNSPLIPDVLLWIATQLHMPDLADKLVAEGKIPRPASRTFYNRYVPGIADWQLVGPFNNEADVAQRRAYDPEKQVDLTAAYGAGDEAIHWQVAHAERDSGFLNIAQAVKSSQYQAAYAVVWVQSKQPQRAWLFVESPNVLSAWSDAARLMENQAGEKVGRGSRGGQMDPVPISLNAGWNQLLLKVCNRTGAWGFRARLANVDGSRIDGLEFSTRQQKTSLASPTTAP